VIAARGAAPRQLRGAAWVVLGLTVAALAGCPFTSDTPLSDPAGAVPDTRLVGTWRTQDPETGEWNSLTILSFNEHEMAGFAREKDPDKLDAFRLFPTSIGKDKFLSFQELGGNDKGWHYAWYEITKGTLRLKIVDDGLFGDRTFSSPGQLVDFIRQHAADPLLYSADDEQPLEMQLVRVTTSGT
jgi:hypothetical protein